MSVRFHGYCLRYGAVYQAEYMHCCPAPRSNTHAQTSLICLCFESNLPFKPAPSCAAQDSQQVAHPATRRLSSASGRNNKGLVAKFQGWTWLLNLGYILFFVWNFGFCYLNFCCVSYNFWFHSTTLWTSWGNTTNWDSSAVQRFEWWRN